MIEGYNQARPFSSFLPGIAGEYGKPLWVFYANRGQVICSFGVRNKNGSMLEFYPANKAYMTTPLLGFRTFMRVHRGSQLALYEPFRVDAPKDIVQIMRIRPYEVEIEEVHPKLGLRTTVAVCTVPNESLPVLLRFVRIENLKRQPVRIECSDGLPQIVPFGLNESLLKQMSRTMEAFAEVLHHKEGLPFFKLKTEPSDRPEVVWIHGGFFSFSSLGQKRLPVIIDPEAIFGVDTSFQHPAVFWEGSSVTSRPQRTESHFGCAFSYASMRLGKEQSQTLYSYYGQAGSWEEASAFRKRVMATSEYAEQKRVENAVVITQATDAFAVRSGSTLMDAYTQQTYLDNALRGGLPWAARDGEQVQVFHWGTRKHGDMERDYNFFEVAPSYFSQGNGNFRDVNQNRRCEGFLYPGSDTNNIETFFNLLQLDGFNPLIIQYEKFQVDGRLFQPGELFEKLLKTNSSRDAAQAELTKILAHAVKVQDASHGEGFWSDHWTYNLDLLENFVGLYPERLRPLLIDQKTFTYFDNDHVVQPRDKKYVLRADGAVRQAHAVVKDAEKVHLLRRRKSDPHKVRTQGGMGVIYQSSLAAKMFGLIAVKAASLDPFGVGIEMESDKPGWCDALNGLPALLGSSVNESFELLRWTRFLSQYLPHVLKDHESVGLPEEMADLLRAVGEALALARADDFFKTWDTLSALKERFRERTRLGLTGKETQCPRAELEHFLHQVEAVLKEGLAKAFTPDGLCVTYYVNEVVEFEKLPVKQTGDDSETHHPQHVRALKFKQVPLSYFLEGPMHALRVCKSPKEAKTIYQAVKRSALFDRKLKMYKLNVPLEKESFEIGRNKIFTPGWLENESIFLHMHYKYLLETLRSGLAEEVFDDMKTGVVAFMKPEIYGRSVLENSSFIASSRFPDSRLHGTGFVSRLSGSTVEWISILLHMGLGQTPFLWDGKELRFAPKPVLPQWLFTTSEEAPFGKDTFAFKLFGRTWIVYHNSKRRSTYARPALSPTSYRLRYEDGREVSQEGGCLVGASAEDLRDGKIDTLTIQLA